MNNNMNDLAPVHAAYEKLAKAIQDSGPWPRAEIPRLVRASHLSRREVEALLKESGNANTPENVKRAAKEFNRGELITFADLAEGLGNPRLDGIGLGAVVKTDAVPPQVAARIIRAADIKGSVIKLHEKATFNSQSTTPRAEHLRSAGVPFEVDGEWLIIPVSTLVTGRELKKRLSKNGAQ